MSSIRYSSTLIQRHKIQSSFGLAILFAGAVAVAIIKGRRRRVEPLPQCLDHLIEPADGHRLPVSHHIPSDIDARRKISFETGLTIGN